MKFSLKFVAMSAMAAAAFAAPIEVEKRATTSEIIISCFIGLMFTGSWPGSCQAAIASDVGLIKGIALNQLTMDFTPANDWAPTLSSSSLVATMLSIPGMTLPINSIRQQVLIADNGAHIGTFNTPWTPASVSGSSLTSTIPTSTLNVLSDSHTAFSHFVGSIAAKETYPLTLKGAVDAKLNLGIFGSMTIPGIGFNAVVPIAGLNGLRTANYIFTVAIDPVTNPGFINIAAVVTLNNPSKLTLKLGDLSLSTSSANGYVGISKMRNLVLAPGINYVLSETALDASKEATTKVLNDIYAGDVPLTLTGFSGTSSDAALNAGLAAIRTTLNLPFAFEGNAMSQSPYKDWAIKVLPNTGADMVLQLTATFQSPYYGFPVKVSGDQAQGGSNGMILGVTGANDFTAFKFANNLSVSIPSTGSVTTTFNVALNTPVGNSKSQWQALVAFAKTNGYIPIVLSINANVVINNDGVDRIVDWGSAIAGSEVQKFKTGPDFASILNFA